MRTCELADEAIVVKGAVLQDVPADENDKALGHQSGSHGPWRVEREDWRGYLDGIYVGGMLLVASRLHAGNVNDRQS